MAGLTIYTEAEVSSLGVGCDLVVLLAVDDSAIEVVREVAHVFAHGAACEVGPRNELLRNSLRNYGS